MNRTARWTIGALTYGLLTMMPATLFAGPLPTDPNIHSGTLDNGVKWMYRQHDNPPGKMALMLHIDSGSLNETDEQQGLAHFIEHMCFNGSEHFPPGELIPYFESIGMEFGADLNAFTSFDQTVYMLFTPDTETAQLDKALTVLSDYAFRASMIAEEIDKERGVVLEESRRGKGAFQRVRDKLWPELFEGSRFARRLPIGDDDIIANASRKEFVDYYKTWYRPELATVVLVGDAPVDRITPLIRKWFGEYKSEVPARKQERAEFKPFTKARAMVVTDPELAICQVQMLNILPARPPVTTTDAWRKELVESIGSWIIGRRYQERVQKGQASYRNASASADDFFHDGVLVFGSAGGEPQDWEKMLDELVTEIHRAREHGFTQRELDLAKKELLAEAERAVKTEPTQNARNFAFNMVFAVNNKEPVMSAQQKLDLHKQMLPTIERGEVNAAFKENFTPGTFAYAVTMVEKDGVAVPSRDRVLEVGEAAWKRTVHPLEQDDAPTELLASLPTPGEIAATETDPDLQITQAWLSNGVRVHHRYMDYKKDTVLVSISLAGGPIEESPSTAGITEVAALIVDEPATNRLTSTNVRDLMTGKNINVGASASGDNLMIRVTGSPEDLEHGLQLVHALLTDGKLEESAFNNWKLRTLQRIEMMNRMPMFKAFEAMSELLGGGDPRVTPINQEKVERQTLATAQAWFDRLRTKAPIEVAIVGDISLEQAMSLARRYLGSLSERARTADALDKLRKLPRSTGPLSRELKVDTMTPQAMAIAGFFSCEGKNAHDTRALELAAHVMTSRLVKRIREDLSWVYSIRATSDPSWIYADSGRFASGAPCDPANVDKVVNEVFTMFEEFAKTGPTEDELSNAKKQIANNLDTEMREPSYWWNVLQHYDLHGVSLAEEKREKEAYQKFTVAEVTSVFKKYFTPERQFKVTAVPVQADTPSGEQEQKEKEKTKKDGDRVGMVVPK